MGSWPRRWPELGANTAEINAWAASGAMALTGRAHRAPLGPPAGLVPTLARFADQLAEHPDAAGYPLRVDPLALLGERAAIGGLRRQGSISCGGATRLLPTRDGWLAVTLARPDDVDLLPAWLEQTPPLPPPWVAVAAFVGSCSTAAAVERATLLGLPVAGLPAPTSPAATAPGRPGSLPVRRREMPLAPVPPRPGALRVIDLSALWAGPLCGSLLAATGAEVIKVEATGRPDGARRGPSGFFDLLNAGKRSVALDLTEPQGVGVLIDLLRDADVVIEASRPRALEQLGIHAEAVMATGRVKVWTSITAHGQTAPGRERVGFGDDAAVAGGLVVWDAAGPCFCADAVADPLTGLVAALATLDSVRGGGRWRLDVAMAEVAAAVAGPTQPIASAPVVAAPRARSVRHAAAPLGAHNATVLGTGGRR